MYPTKWGGGSRWGGGPAFEPESMEVWVEQKNGNLIPWTEFRTMLVTHQVPDDLTKFIELDAFTVSLRLVLDV